jgi:hypothetical protein
VDLADEIQKELDMAVKSSAAGLGALTEGPQTLDAMGAFENIALPMLMAQRGAILRLAREVEQLSAGDDS